MTESEKSTEDSNELDVPCKVEGTIFSFEIALGLKG